ncbi:MAG TPA: FAD-dependent oxidoreductase [Thermoanaerobaculia bacterium]|nr:FAD-dependent oxidoreductase [Thermoanaerobaculia bacterium]
MSHPWDFEVAVIGGGPGGAAAAAALARRGHRVLVLERERFPRFHIGESQLPSMNEVLERIGAEHAIADAGFVEKWGASFATADGEGDQYADFTHAWEVPRPRTWQVPRARFDEILLEHAAKSGARVLQERSAVAAEFDEEGVTLSHSGKGGDRVSVRVGAVIDASGHAGFLAKTFGERRRDPLLQNVAVHRQFEGIPRSEGRRAGDIRMVTRPDRGWFWFIPISEAVISVGVVVPLAVFRSAVKPTPEETLATFVAETPAAARLMSNARPVSPARVDADYSYLHSRHAGDRFALVGDAGAFLDPIFSTGVLMAMQSGIEAAEAVSEGLRAGDLKARRFASYERRLVRRYHYFRRFAAGFYDPAFRDLFFSRSSRFGIYESILSVLAGNWRPSFKVRLRLELFFLLVAIRRLIPLTRRRKAIGVSRQPLSESH